MSKRDMYDASKRAWLQLPEVRSKLLEEKRKSQAVTNRLRVKLYQKVLFYFSCPASPLKWYYFPYAGGVGKIEKIQQTQTLNHIILVQ